MPPLAIPARSICAVDALVRKCGFGRTLPRQCGLRHSCVPRGVDWLDARLGGSLFRACCDRATGECFLAGEHD